MEGKEEIKRYIADFEETEKRHLYPFGEELCLPKSMPVYHVEPDKLNIPEVIEIIKSLQIDCFAVFGTSLVKEELLNLTPNYINIHLGLSPYYRGTATTFWPYNNEPEYVGVTVLHLDKGIDSGSIIHQSLVSLEPGDTIHDGSLKAIRSGIELQVKAIEELTNGTLQSHPQDLSQDKTYYAKDFNVHVLREVKKRWNETSIGEYIKNQDRLKEKIKYIP